VTTGKETKIGGFAGQNVIELLEVRIGSADAVSSLVNFDSGATPFSLLDDRPTAMNSGINSTICLETFDLELQNGDLHNPKSAVWRVFSNAL
jgi:hypothetical protein